MQNCDLFSMNLMKNCLVSLKYERPLAAATFSIIITKIEHSRMRKIQTFLNSKNCFLQIGDKICKAGSQRVKRLGGIPQFVSEASQPPHALEKLEYQEFIREK